MEITLTTPALLFPAISLLLLAYTNRFLALAALVRQLHKAYHDGHEARVLGQIQNLRTRLRLIRDMQVLGIASLLLCVATMFVLFGGYETPGRFIFGAALVLMLASLALSIWETQISTAALTLHLSDLEDR